MYIVGYKGIKLYGLGNALQIKNGLGIVHNEFGIIPEGKEQKVVELLASSIDILLFNPSDSFTTENGNRYLFDSLIKQKKCIVVFDDHAKNIATDWRAGNLHMYKVYPESGISNEELFLQMGFFFSVYETLRDDMATPSPLLGLAPIGASKSFNYQIGEKAEQLLKPMVSNVERNQKKITNMRTGITFLDNDRKKTQENIVIDYEIVLKHNLSIMRKFSERAFFWGYFPNPKEGTNIDGNFTLPFYIANKKAFEEIYYLPPFRINEIHKYPPKNFAKYSDSYLQCSDLLGIISNCAECEDEHLCEVENRFAISSSEPPPKTDSVLRLLRHVMPIYELEADHYCILKMIEVGNNTTGILIILVKCEITEKDDLLRKICKEIIVKKISSPDNLFYKFSKCEGEEGNVSVDNVLIDKDNVSVDNVLIDKDKDEIIWIKLENLKRALEKAGETAQASSDVDKTTETAKKHAKETSDSIETFKAIVDKALAKRNTSSPSIASSFFEHAKQILSENTKEDNNIWKNYFSTSIKNALDDICKFYEQKRGIARV